MNKFFTDASKYSFGPLSFFATNITCNDPKTLYVTQIKTMSKDMIPNMNSNCYCGKSLTSEDAYLLLFQKEIQDVITEEGRTNL